MSKSQTKTTQFEPDVADREELTTKSDTHLDDYEDDGTTDPEGKARRAETNRRLLFPPYVFDEYRLSARTYWGKPWEDGKEHLVPLDSTVDEVMHIHDNSGTVFADLANGAKSEIVDPMVKASCDFMDAMGDAGAFAFMQGFGDTVNKMFAERAYSKYLFLRYLDRLGDKDVNEYGEGLETRMMAAAENLGNFYKVHLDLWDHLQWKNEPTYPRVKNAVELRLVNAAKWVDENRRNTEDQMAKVSHEDRRRLASMC